MTESSKSYGQVAAITNNVNTVDPVLRRAGRLDKEIKVDIPGAKERLQILKLMLGKTKNTLKEEDINEINSDMNGFTGADVLTLIRESFMQFLNRMSGNDKEDQSGANVVEAISKEDIEKALVDISPSGLKDLILEIPKVLWSEIGGNDDIKKQIKHVIEWPLKHPEAFVRMGIKPSKGILLYGPPGCSKTMTAKAIATESNLNFIAIKGPELFSKYVGDSEKAIRNLFKRARLCAPCVIFFDEIDAIATQRSSNTDVSERVLCQLLNEMDGVESLKSVIVVAATNRPDIIDAALMRPGRFDHLIYVPPPDLQARTEIFRINIHGNKMPAESDVKIEELAQMTEGYSGAEINLICREAGLYALSRDILASNVRKSDFEAAIKKIKPRISKMSLMQYENLSLIHI
eukprot:TRINITY_DN9902_c0_g1_i3.p1 TRINITY_DN9902_c0_g1~~TRINITY_DN9902_c0_g1_i3.p1  ORF type:complete len:404 (-),score=72.11 TRINITY_DN9902_c0_g1_i3:66-1277(-)